MNETVSTRSSRNRRVVALMGWGCLVITSFFLWNARQSGSIRAVTDEPVAFILAAFSAFVGVFAWMLYNPGRRTASASPSLFFAALATLFPPSIIGFCLMPVDSPLRWWLALGLFLLCVVAVLSHVPDEFFGVPRGRASYFTPMPAFDRVEGTVLDPNASWFTREDLTKVVLDTPRQSLAPRSYLQRGESSRPAAPVRAEVRQGSEVDDILGTDFDLGLLEDDFDYDDRPATRTVVRQRPSERQAFREADVPSDGDRNRRSPTTTRKGGTIYNRVNPDSGRLRMDQRSRREATARSTSVGYSPNRTTRHASTLRVQPTTGRGTRASLSAFGAGAGGVSRSYRRAEPETQSELESVAQIARRREETDRQVQQREQAQREQAQREQEQRERSEREQAAREEKERAEVQREAQRREEARQLAAAEAKARADRERDLREREERARREAEQERKSASARSEQRTGGEGAATPSSKSGIGALPVPIPFGVSDVASGLQAQDEAPAQQLFGQTIQRDSSARPAAAEPTTSGRSKRRSRYEDDSPEATEPVASTKREPVQTSSLKKQQQNFERTRDDDGSELVEGVMQIHFDKGQKRANVHIPFSPPLPGMPEVDCECVGGEDLRLKVPVRQSYGIRIEARRSNADQPLDAEVGFAAVYTDD